LRNWDEWCIADPVWARFESLASGAVVQEKETVSGHVVLEMLEAAQEVEGVLEEQELLV